MKLSKLLATAALSCLMLASAGAQAADRGTAAEAKAMLEKALAAVKAGKAAALEQFTAEAKAKAGTFFAKDLYVFCGGPDGNFSAHPSLVGKSMRALMDKGTPPAPVGEKFYAAGAAGGGEVAYTWPLPTGGDPIAKVAIVGAAEDQVCAVGYYP